MSMEKQLQIKFPIYWNESAAEERFMKYLIYKIVTHRPVNVVELGSGISSLIILKVLESLKYRYNFTSFDSDKFFLEETKNLLISENVYNDKVNLVYSKITDIKIGENIYKWYNAKDFKFSFNKIDLLFIDGPLGSLSKNSRYPALDIMKDYLGDGSLVILHDAKRKDEVEIIETWRKENLKIKHIYKIETERGGAEIQF